MPKKYSLGMTGMRNPEGSHSEFNAFDEMPVKGAKEASKKSFGSDGPGPDVGATNAWNPMSEVRRMRKGGAGTGKGRDVHKTQA